MNLKLFTVAVSILMLSFITFSSLNAKPTIAVVDFTGRGVPDTEAAALSDRLRTELVKIGQYEIVEREMMNVLLAEQGFQMTGCVSDKCIVAAGQILGVAQMVAGSISKVGEVYSVSARVVDVETGKIIKVATYDHEGKIGELLISGMEYVAKVLTGEIEEEPRRTEKKISQPPEQLKTQGSAIGLSWSLPYPGGWNGVDNEFFGNWMLSLEYSKGITPRLFLGFDLGFGKLEYTVRESSFGDWKEVDGAQYTLLARIHYSLNPGRHPGILTFLGLGAMRAQGISRWTRDINGIPTISYPDHHDVFMIIPVGLSANFTSINSMKFIVDLGYMFSPKTGGSSIFIGPSGFIASLRIRWHF